MDDAIAACKKAIEREPDYFIALLVMATVFGMSGQQEDQNQQITICVKCILSSIEKMIS